MKKHRAIGAALIAIGTLVQAHAQSASPEDRLRDQLRQTTLQLRQLEDENSDLKEKLNAANQQAATAAKVPKASAEEARLNRQLKESGARVTTLEQQLDAMQKSLDQWKQAYQQAATVARTRDGDARTLDAKLRDSESHVQSCEGKNTRLVQISDELLERYKNKGAWESLKNEEPLTGLDRVDLEKIAQDYHGRIVDATVQPPAVATTPQ